MNRLHQAIDDAGGDCSWVRPCIFTIPSFWRSRTTRVSRSLWIEMEHAPISFAEASDLCRMAAGTGMPAMIRIPDTRRESVLKTAECAPTSSTFPRSIRPSTWTRPCGPYS